MSKSLKMFIREIKDIPQLDPEEQKQLLEAVHDESLTDEERIACRNRIADHNMKLVVACAAKYHGKGLSDEDLIQEGTLGLLHAIEKFDPSKECALSTYAYPWIMQCIERSVNANAAGAIRVPERVMASMKKVLKAIYKIADDQHKLLCEVTDVEVAKELGESPEWVNEIRDRIDARSVVSTEAIEMKSDGEVGVDEDYERGLDFIDQETETPIESVINSSREREIARVLKDILKSDRLCDIIMMWMGFVPDVEPENLAAIGEYLGARGEKGVSRERIRQQKEEAMKILKEPQNLIRMKEVLR